MSATEEAMAFLHSQHIMAAPYVLLIASVASLIFLAALFLVNSYKTLSANDSLQLKTEESSGFEMRPFLHQPDEEAQAREFEISD